MADELEAVRSVVESIQRRIREAHGRGEQPDPRDLEALSRERERFRKMLSDDDDRFREWQAKEFTASQLIERSPHCDARRGKAKFQSWRNLKQKEGTK
jgi:hypothetical protein